MATVTKRQKGQSEVFTQKAKKKQKESKNIDDAPNAG